MTTSGHGSVPSGLDPRQPAITLDKVRSAHRFARSRGRADPVAEILDGPTPVLRPLVLVFVLSALGAVLSVAAVAAPALVRPVRDDRATERAQVSIAEVAHVYRWLESLRRHG